MASLARASASFFSRSSGVGEVDIVTPRIDNKARLLGMSRFLL